MAKSPSKLQFETSAPLKRAFTEHFATWSKKHRLGLSDLAARCGVSQQYISHIARYGRVPSQPVLLLLTLNLEIGDAEQFLRLASSRESWPFDSGVSLRPRSASDSGLLSINLDMGGFTQAIREIVRGELRPRSLPDLLGGKPLKVGLNAGQSFLFTGGTNKPEGFFPEFIRLLALGMQCEVTFIKIPHTTYAAKLESGEIDCYGPIYLTPHRVSEALFTHPFAQVTIAGLFRNKANGSLIEVAAPKRLSDLKKHPYIIAVHKDSMSHHLAAEELQIPVERLIICESAEETVERVVMNKLPRPAHLVLTDTPHAALLHNVHRSQTSLVLFDTETHYEDGIAVRKGWEVLANLMNETLELLVRNGTFSRLAKRYIEERKVAGVTLQTSAR